MGLLPRERIIRVLKRTGNLDRVPWSLDFGASSAFTPSSWEKFHQFTGIEDTAEHFDFEVRLAHAEKETPRFHTSSSSFGLRMVSNGLDRLYFEPPLPEEATLTPWGVGLIPWPDNPGSEEMVHPLQHARTVKDIDDFPSPGIDSESIPLVAAKARKILTGGYMSASYCGSVYEWCHWLRGMEEFMIDLVSRPEMAEALIRKVASFTQRFAREHAKCGVEILCFYDDYGMQSCLQIDPRLWRRYFQPVWSEIIHDLKANFPQVFFFLHTCGHIQDIIPDLVDAGFDVIHPLQPECQDPEKIIMQYGDRMSFWGTISVQRTLPFSTPEEVAQEVRSRMDLARAMPSLIVSPSNTLGKEVPVENIISYIEACQNYCEG